MQFVALGPDQPVREATDFTFRLARPTPPRVFFVESFFTGRTVCLLTGGWLNDVAIEPAALVRGYDELVVPVESLPDEPDIHRELSRFRVPLMMRQGDVLRLRTSVAVTTVALFGYLDEVSECCDAVTTIKKDLGLR